VDRYRGRQEAVRLPAERRACTYDHLVPNWLSDNMEMFWSKKFLAPNNPDLNPMDYSEWSVIERVINKSRHRNVTSPQAAIETAFRQ